MSNPCSHTPVFRDRALPGILLWAAQALVFGAVLHLPAADLTTTGGGNIILDGSNSWILHTPDDGRTSLYVAPKKNNAWSWGDAFLFNHDGSLNLKTICPQNIYSANPIWANARFQFYSPGNYLPSIEVCGEGNKDSFALYHAWSKAWYSTGVRAADGQYVISPGNTLHNSNNFVIRYDGTALVTHHTGQAGLELAGDNYSQFVRYHDWSDAAYCAGYHRCSRKFRIANAWDLESNPLLEMDSGSITAHRHLNGTSMTLSGNVQAGAVRAGYIGTARLQVRSDWWADHVFADGYRLAPLTEVADYIRENRHLPAVPSEAEVRRDGIDTAGMFAVQMRKIEELTLHIIDLDRRAQAKDAEIAGLQHELAALRAVQERQAALLARLADRLGHNGKEP